MGVLLLLLVLIGRLPQTPTEKSPYIWAITNHYLQTQLIRTTIKLKQIQ